MKAFLIRRLLQTIITLFMVTVISFTICMVLPGDPTYSLIGEEGATPEMVNYLRHKYGLDQSLHVQYFKWLGAIANGDLGVSLRTRVHVVDMFLQRLPVTLEVLIFGIFFALIIAVPLGIISSLRPNTWIDSLGTVVAVSGGGHAAVFAGHDLDPGLFCLAGCAAAVRLYRY